MVTDFHQYEVSTYSLNGCLFSLLYYILFFFLAYVSILLTTAEYSA